MDHFELVSEYAPTGDQPQAIDQLVKAFKKETNARLYWELQALARRSQWQTSYNN